MAKLTFTINDFSGGANGYVDPLDIADNELAQCQGFKAEPGVVSVLGDMKGAYTLGASVTAATGNMDIEPGYGLFSFSHDYDMAGGTTDLGTNLALSSTDYFFMMVRDDDSSLNRIDVFDSADNVWRPNMIDLSGSDSTNRMTSIKPCFFIAEGTVRISPGNFLPVASGGTLISSGTTGDFAAEVNPGGFELVVTDVGLEADVAVGDTIILGKASADAPGQEMIALITNDGSNDEALTAARNMTGTFNSAVDASVTDVIYVIPDTRWRGVVKRKNFPQAGIAGTFTEWYSTYAHPRPPVTFHANLAANTVPTQYTMPFLVLLAGPGDGDDPTNDGSIPPTLIVTYKNDGTNDDATWDGATIHLYCTALYDQINQE